jgi:hypothetical protein
MKRNRSTTPRPAVERPVAKLLAGICLAAACAAHADTVRINDNGYDPGGPHVLYTLKSTRFAATDDPNNFSVTNYTYTLVQPQTRGYEWSNLTRLDNVAREGEHVALYGQGWKWGHASTWGGVLEAEDFDGTGTVIGAEVDVGSFGPATGSRTGLLVATANTKPDQGVAVIDNAIAVVPVGPPEQTRLRYGVLVSHDCEVACFAVKTGQAYALDSKGSITLRYDEKARRIVFQVDGKERFGINIDDGALFSNGALFNGIAANVPAKEGSGGQ